MSPITEKIAEYFKENPPDMHEIRSIVESAAANLQKDLQNPKSIPETIVKAIHLETMLACLEVTIKEVYGIEYELYRAQITGGMNTILLTNYQGPTPCEAHE